MIAIMGRMARNSGQVARWDDAINSKMKLGPEEYAFDSSPPVRADAGGVYPVAVPGVTRSF